MPDLRTLPDTKPATNRHLPAEHELSHVAAFSFLDQLTALIAELEASGRLSVTIQLCPGQEGELEGKAGDELWEWLADNGYKDAVRSLGYRQVAVALMADLSSFASEALVAAAKGKLTVAFSLLRKPFKENLCLLEWILCDPTGFFDALEAGIPSDYQWKALDSSQRRSVIADALSRIDLQIFDAEFLYDVRYSKQCPYGLEYLWQKATHLVTTFKGLKTEPGNLNFVFSSLAALEEQWEQFYLVVPPLLMYALSVSEAVVGQFVSWDPTRRRVKELLRTLAFIRHSDEISGTQSTVTSMTDELLESLNQLVVLICERCGVAIPIDDYNVDRLWSSAEVECACCHAVEDLWGAMFPEDADDSSKTHISWSHSM